MKRSEPIVAIDGPAGAGKSTVSREVARRLGYLLLDTGALYRAVALAARDRGVSWDDAGGVGAVARDLVERQAIVFEAAGDGRARVVLEGRDVSEAIRAQEMGQGASRVSAIGAVRRELLELQRRAARGGGVVLEGRDIGTVVLPDAEAKFFLTARTDVRAARRHRELMGRGVASDVEEVQREVEERDQRDSTRAVAPLRKADDAIVVDSSDIGIDEVVERIVQRVESIRRQVAGVDDKERS